jgi:hypothetical protein
MARRLTGPAHLACSNCAAACRRASAVWQQRNCGAAVPVVRRGPSSARGLTDPLAVQVSDAQGAPAPWVSRSSSGVRGGSDADVRPAASTCRSRRSQSDCTASAGRQRPPRQGRRRPQCRPQAAARSVCGRLDGCSSIWSPVSAVAGPRPCVCTALSAADTTAAASCPPVRFGRLLSVRGPRRRLLMSAVRTPGVCCGGWRSPRVSAATGSGRPAGVRWWDAASAGTPGRPGGRAAGGAARARRSWPAAPAPAPPRPSTRRAGGP